MRALVLGQGKSGEAAAAVLRAQGAEVEFASDFDLVVASPGVPVKSELQLGCEELVRRGWKLLAVTGSKGKSSVVKLLAEALHGVPCGNFGTPVCELLSREPGWAVVEVSSYQLETTSLAPDTFEAATILNLQEDHLARHGSVAVYHALKRKLLTFAKIAVVPDVAGVESALRGSYFDNDILRVNGFCAAQMLRAVGVAEAEIRRAFLEFRPLPHRMELIAEQAGVRFIDDSKATSLTALAAGVTMCAGSVRLIAGGLAKGDDPKSLCSLLTKRVKKVYLIGRCAEEFELAWRNSVPCEICGTLSEAVKSARGEAVEGETILLSPGTASFDQFKSFEERGEAFANLVKNKE